MRNDVPFIPFSSLGFEKSIAIFSFSDRYKVMGLTGFDSG